jgi:hypothetical protein
LRRTFFGGPDGPQKLIRALKEGHLSLEKAQDIIN